MNNHQKQTMKTWKFFWAWQDNEEAAWAAADVRTGLASGADRPAALQIQKGRTCRLCLRHSLGISGKER